MYGAKGAFRPKHYGVEYRVPSNAWLRYPALHKWMFNITRTVYSNMMSGYGTYPLTASNKASYFVQYLAAKDQKAWDKPLEID